MYREENLLEAIASEACLKCGTDVRVREVWDNLTLYKQGDCSSCGYEHTVFVKKA